MHPWTLDPDVIHLNHGSFGACPAPVLEEQRRWQRLMESNPVLFFTKTLQPALDMSRQALASFIECDVAGLVFVPNATSGINTVLRSLEPALGPGDEILITDHTYNACRNVAEVAALRAGARLVEVPVPFPLDSMDRYTDAVLARVSSSTRVVMIDAVTSPTALLVPVTDIVSALEPEITVLVDAAHAPGMIALDLGNLGASYVVGNCHKWMCAPKGSGFLFARADKRSGIVPGTVSHGWNTDPSDGAPRLHHLFDWTGTDDPSARLSVPAAIETIAGFHDHGWDGVMATNRALAAEGRDTICAALLYHALEFSTQALQAFDPRLHVMQVIARNLVDFHTGMRRFVAERQDFANPLERKPEFARMPDKAQPVTVCVGIDSLITGAARRLRQQTDFLVIAYGLYLAIAGFRYIAYRKVAGHRRLSLKLQ